MCSKRGMWIPSREDDACCEDADNEGSMATEAAGEDGRVFAALVAVDTGTDSKNVSLGGVGGGTNSGVLARKGSGPGLAKSHSSSPRPESSAADWGAV